MIRMNCCSCKDFEKEENREAAIHSYQAARVRPMMEEDDGEDQDRETIGQRMIETLPSQTLQEYKDIFSYFDRDGGGSITTLELGQVMKTFGWTPTEFELREMINVVDQDGNGQITFNEFVWLMTREIHDTDIEEEIREAFRVFDREGHGFLSSQEMSHVLQSIGDPLTPEETEELINDADIDGDGNINYEEFITILFKSKSGLKSKE